MEYSALQIHSLKNVDIIDTRSVEEFAKEHIPESLHLPLVPNFVAYAKLVLDGSKPIILILEKDSLFASVSALFKQIGFEHVLGYLKGGMSAWNYPIETLPTVSVNELEECLQQPHTALIDVRTDSEFCTGHILKAIHCPMGSTDCYHIPSHDALYIICGGGTRSSIMASILRRKGYPNVHNVKGGMSAWRSR